MLHSVDIHMVCTLQSPSNYHSQDPMPQGQYPRPENRSFRGNNSLEETWMDLVNILELPSNESSAGLMNNMTGPGRMMTPQNHSNALIQNVTMPAPINNTVNTNSFEPRKSQPHGDRNATTTFLLTLKELSFFLMCFSI